MSRGHPALGLSPATWRTWSSVLLILPAWGAPAPQADEATETRALDVVVTTATKKSQAEAAGDVPGAVSVLSSDTLAVRQVTDLEDLSYALPNVALDGIGTGKGIANFSIRGLGVAGSIPSIDPTVGVSVDGVYLGVNYGVVVDMLDLEAVEVLRGPQGLLFGRNASGGAVLLRSRRPRGESSANAAIRVETGLEKRFVGSAEGVFRDGSVAARLSVGIRDDDGWFNNSAPAGGAVGAEATRVVRPVLTWTPSDLLDVTLIYERGNSDGDGPATQNRRRFGGFEFAIDEPGFSRVDWRHVIAETTGAWRWAAARSPMCSAGALSSTSPWPTSIRRLRRPFTCSRTPTKSRSATNCATQGGFGACGRRPSASISSSRTSVTGSVAFCVARWARHSGRPGAQDRGRVREQRL